jgi:hypothetical protein
LDFSGTEKSSVVHTQHSTVNKKKHKRAKSSLNLSEMRLTKHYSKNKNTRNSINHMFQMNVSRNRFNRSGSKSSPHNTKVNKIFTKKMIQKARNHSDSKNELQHLITMGSQDSFEPTHF